MDLFKGLNAAQTGALRHVRQYETIPGGTVIFSEGDAADHLCVVVSGSVQIFRRTSDGDAELARLGPREVFGEMGIVNEAGWRTASARALEDTIVMRFAANPIELFQQLGDPQAALTILQNLVGMLGDRLRAKDDPNWRPLREWTKPSLPNIGPHRGDVVAKLREALPKGILRRLLGEKKLEPGGVLCSQGDKPEGFYFIHEGSVLVEQTLESGEVRVMGTLTGPTIAGEIGFFTGERRSSTLKALTPLRYEVFSGSEFKKLAAKKPDEAFQMLFAIAQLAVCLIIEREEG